MPPEVTNEMKKITKEPKFIGLVIFVLLIIFIVVMQSQAL